MERHPIEGLMITAMNSIQNMVDVNTIIGTPIKTGTSTIIPISKVGFGFAAGGSEFNCETINEYKVQDKDEEITYKLPFGGGAGAGVNITPVAFLVVNDNNESCPKLLRVENSCALDKFADTIPDIIERIDKFMNKKEDKKQETTEKNPANKEKKEIEMDIGSEIIDEDE